MRLKACTVCAIYSGAPYIYIYLYLYLYLYIYIFIYLYIYIFIYLYIYIFIYLYICIGSKQGHGTNRAGPSGGAPMNSGVSWAARRWKWRSCRWRSVRSFCWGAWCGPCDTKFHFFSEWGAGSKSSTIGWRDVLRSDTKLAIRTKVCVGLRPRDQ